MRITACGAADEVTGSSYLLETSRASVLVDFGLFQGNRHATKSNKEGLSIYGPRLDAVILTHAHLDHSGRLPLLPRLGFRGKVHGTPATLDLLALLLEDSAHIQEGDVRRRNRRRKRSGKKQIEPLYRHQDVERILERIHPIRYYTPQEVAPGVTVLLREAGHILGSATAELTVEEGETKKVIVFSGDIGPRDVPYLRDPDPPTHADLVFMESTYGGRDHRSLTATVEEFEEILIDAEKDGKKLLVPAFAVGRTQQLFFHIAQAIREGTIGRFPLYLDSPLGAKASALYRTHKYLFDEESQALTRARQFAKDLSALSICATPEQSMALNDVSGPCLIVAGAGMCNGGRILHHFKHSLFRPSTSVLIVGYQAHGTLGSRLIHGAKRVRIFGQDIAVRASIHTLGGFSAHAGHNQLVQWFGNMAASRPRVAVMHGESKSRRALGQALAREYGVKPEYPARHEALDL